MNNVFQTTAVIRKRGQLTIPDKIRDKVSWLNTESVIIIRAQKTDEIIIQPYKEESAKKVDWKKIWDAIRLARSFKGKRGNLSQFIVEDRERH